MPTLCIAHFLLRARFIVTLSRIYLPMPITTNADTRLSNPKASIPHNTWNTKYAQAKLSRILKHPHMVSHNENDVRMKSRMAMLMMHGMASIKSWWMVSLTS